MHLKVVIKIYKFHFKRSEKLGQFNFQVSILYDHKMQIDTSRNKK